ncbi:MAG: SMI1/KNR4 family protein [Flavobacteriaceae bacterium]|jgi:hypothetical protein|uniref:SMI1/KNR4 family protein n=1 Tax=Elizabethkingia ursingii TaxID=1756150 RepID=UPI002011BDF4|nr:SMI1/KNR4 family protein [Elizabethkingia ursingii]MCL1672121.1 SMI1/KNR4 family protein [Elizabethkingia ursingii]MDR2231134.1 SMI1/KNR4 family protein [Flavobacteriaceae bacterium]
MYLTTDKLDPNRQNKVESFDQNLLEILPKDYLDFLRKFGTGGYCGEVYIMYPDSQIIPSTFKDYTDLWELNNSYNVEDLLTSIQIGSTANGDIICITEHRIGKIFILPRHSMEIIAFTTFNDAIKSFIMEEKSMIYFDPDFDREQEQISLIKSIGGLIDILPIQEKFLQLFSYDFVINENTQPQYFFRKIGGWVTFDLVYKNSIYVKFQNQNCNDVLPITNFLKEYAE